MIRITCSDYLWILKKREHFKTGQLHLAQKLQVLFVMTIVFHAHHQRPVKSILTVSVHVLRGFSKNQWVAPTFKALLAIFAPLNRLSHDHRRTQGN
jgi:hypothetical protein